MHSLISLYVSDDSSQIIISDTLFSGNIRSVGGGALYLSIGWNTNLPLIVTLSVHHEQSFYNWWVSCRYHCSHWAKTSLHGSIYLSTSFSSTSASFSCNTVPEVPVYKLILSCWITEHFEFHHGSEWCLWYS